VEELVPTPDHREVWFQKKAGSPAKLTATFDDDISFSVVLKQQFGQVHVSAENLPKAQSAEQINRYINANVAFIPGLVGVLVEEPYATSARRNSLASQGRYSEIFRSSLLQLKESDTKLVQKLNAVLEDLFKIQIATIRFDEASDEYVTVEYRCDGEEYDVVSSGSGLQQVIQILTYLYLSHPTILLIDEPDAHLHSRLQGRLGWIFRRVADDLDAQVFLSTHSLDLIDTGHPDEVIIVDSKQRDVRALGRNVDLVSSMVAAGIVENSALSRIIATKRIVIVEDRNLSLYKLIDRTIATELFGSASHAYVTSAEGVGNFQQYNELASMLKSFVEGQLEVVFIQDRDGLPDFLADAYAQSLKDKGMEVVLLNRHELESYLIEPALLRSAAAEKGASLSASQAEATIVDAALELRQQARRMCGVTAKKVNRHLSDSAKLKEGPLEDRVNEWFDGLDGANWQVVTTVWPGKELLKGVRQKLLDEHSIDIRQGLLQTIIKKEHIAREIVHLFDRLAKPPQPKRKRRRGQAKADKAPPEKKTSRKRRKKARS